jgi:hypothetical protein
MHLWLFSGNKIQAGCGYVIGQHATAFLFSVHTVSSIRGCEDAHGTRVAMKGGEWFPL